MSNESIGIEPPSEKPAAPRRWYRNEWVLLGAILFLGLILRAWYLAEIVHAPDFAAPQQDPAVLDWYARAMVTGDRTVPAGENDPLMWTTPYFRPPGHAYYLAAIYFFTHCSYLAPRIVTMLIGLISVYLIFLLGKRVYRRGVGLIAAFLMATYWGLIFWEGELNDPALFVFLALCLMHVLRGWGDKMTFPRAALAGVLVGCYALMRPNILLYGPVIAGWMVWIAWRRGQLRKIPLSWVGLAGATFLVILPVTMRNYRDSGEFVPISTYFGENFMIGNGQDSDGVTPWLPYLQDLEGTGNWSCWVYVNVVKGVGKELGIPHIKHSAVSTYFYHKTLGFIKEHKLRTLKLAWRKWVLFWTPIEITCNKVVQYEKEYYPPLKFLPGFPLITALFVFGSIFFLADWSRFSKDGYRVSGIGFRGTRNPIPETRNPSEMSFLIFSYVLVYFVSFIPFFVNGRARIPIVPFCILIGAYGLYRTWECFAARRYITGGLCAAAFLALWALASVHFIRFEPTEKTWSYVPSSPDDIQPVYKPDRSRWYYQRADSDLRLGKITEAIDEAKHMLDMPETAAYMDNRLASAFAKAGYVDDALQHFKAAIARHPDADFVRYYMADTLVKAKRVAEGIDAYREEARLHPDNAFAHTNLGMLLANQGNVDEAKAEFEAAARCKPDFAPAHVYLGNLLGGLEKYNEAVAHLERAVELDPDQQNYHFLLAAQLANADRTDDAVAQYRIALKMNPEDARARNNLGLLLANRRQYDEAVKEYNEALRIAPDFTLVYANMGNMLADQGKLDDGIKMYEKGLTIRSNDPGLYNGLGYLLEQKGPAFFGKALDAYREAIRVEPHYSRAYDNIGRVFEKQGKPADAAQAYQEALRAFPRDKDAYLNLGNLAASQNKLDEAVGSYLNALKNDPRNPDIPNNLANALVKKGRIDEAIRYYQQAIAINPRYVNARCNLGVIYLAGGKPEQKAEALRQFKKVLEIDPNQQLARQELLKAEP